MLGGGLRQVGVLAAPGLVALERFDDIRSRLQVDHENARVFAEGVRGIPGLVVDGDSDTNIVVFRLQDRKTTLTHDDVASALAKKGVKVAGFRGRLRAVTCSEVDREQVELAVVTLREVMKELLEADSG